nr:hypothetical protein [Tanacetum cinerariifolium]
MSSFNQQECLGCGQPCDGLYCYPCTCRQCEVGLTNGICLNCTYRDGKPLICCKCDGPLRGGFCWFYTSNFEISFNPNPNSFDDSQNLSNYSPQPQYETYPCELLGNDSHYGYDCPPRQQEQEEQAAQIFTPNWNFSMINDEEEHSIQYKEYLENSSNAITTVLSTKEPEYSLSMGYKHLSTIPETKSNEVIKSSAKSLVPIPSEYEVTSDDESECDVPIKDESSLIFTTFSNPLFDCIDDFTSSDDESLSNEDVLIENFEVYSNSLFDDEEINSNKVDPHYFNAESDPIESYSNRDTLFDSSPKFDYLKEFSGELMPKSIIDEKRIKREHEEYISLMEKLLTINLFPQLLGNDSIPIPENKSSNFDHHDNPSFPRPPPEPPDVEILFDPDSGVLTTNVVKGISEHYVLMPNILPTLPTFDPLYLEYDTLLPFSSENKDKVFKPIILSYLLVSHRDKTTSDFSENPMMMYGGDIPLLDVSYLHFYTP